MLTELRAGLSSIELGLTWDDLAQFPRQLNQPVSVILYSGIELSPNQPMRVILDGRVILWSDNLEQAEEFILSVAHHLGNFLVSECVEGVARIEIGSLSITYSGVAEEGDIEELETVTLTLGFPITVTPSL